MFTGGKNQDTFSYYCWLTLTKSRLFSESEKVVSSLQNIFMIFSKAFQKSDGEAEISG